MNPPFRIAQDVVDHLEHSMAAGNHRGVTLRGIACPQCKGTALHGNARFLRADVKAGARTKVYEVRAVCACGFEGNTDATFRL
jgi:hypothetical protein